MLGGSAACLSRSIRFLAMDRLACGSFDANSTSKSPRPVGRRSRFPSTAVAKTGVVPMPAANEAVLGGHAVLAVGYNHTAQQFLVRNSWGAAWGLAGYFLIPYAYLTNPNLASDFWTIRTVAVTA